jgi:hypothetical protein
MALTELQIEQIAQNRLAAVARREYNKKMFNEKFASFEVISETEFSVQIYNVTLESASYGN